MPLCWLQISSCLVLFLLCSPSNALCPTICSCQASERGRRKVLCIEGGMQDPIPTSEMDPGTQILEISAPDGDWNALTLTPIFQHFKRLEELRIRKSGIQQIGLHPFWGVPTLKLLDLAFNNIATVVDHNFRGLVNLIELNLDDNKIARMQSGVFKYLTELRILTLQRNLLDELVPRLFLKLGKLHVLKLSGNKFEELNPEVFKDIPELRVLECRDCGLRHINTQIYHLLPYLAHLDLGNNRMQFIASDEFHDLRHLHSLKLDGNQLPVVLERAFVRQRELKYLCLARNRLAKITNTAFLNLSSLLELDIGYNKLDKIEMVALQPVADNLQRLVISGNAFGVNVIKDILSTVHKVKEVGLAQMGLKELAKGLVPDTVRKLNVSFNNLTRVTWFPKQLQEVDLSGNQLESLNETVIIRLETLKVVKMGENPWSCRLCHLGAALLRINQTSVFKNITCASPKKVKGRKLASFRLEEFPSCNAPKGSGGPLDKRVTLAVGLTTVLLIFIVCIVFIVSCLRRRARNVLQEQKRIAEMQQENSLDHPIAIFSKGEISFKFPLDLTERRLEVSTIDEIKKDTQTLPNGTGI